MLHSSAVVEIASKPIYAKKTSAELAKTPFQPKYVGFKIPNEFVVGFGLDYAERYRNLQGVGVLTLKPADKGAKSADPKSAGSTAAGAHAAAAK